MHAWTVRSVPQQLRQAVAGRGRPDHRRVARSFIAAVPEVSGHAGASRRGNTRLGGSVAGVAMRVPATEIDFALIGHQESWRAAADVLGVLRGPKRSPLSDEE